MRDKIFEYLLGRPDGAASAELLPLLFAQTGDNEALSDRLLETLLGDDARFERDPATGAWRLAAAQRPAAVIDATPFVVFDLETTDQGRGATAIVEFGAVRVQGGRVVDSIERLVNPGVKLSPFVVKLTGIDNYTLAEQPTLAEVWPEIEAFIGVDVLVAHNAAFDLACLNRAAQACSGRSLTNRHLCTFKLARRLLPDLTRRGLDALAGHFGIATADRHRALADARLTAEIFFHLTEHLRRDGVATVDELLEIQDRGGDGRPFVCSLPRDKVLALPELPGLYRLLGENGEVLYVGRAKSLRSRVSDYLSNAANHGDKTLELIRTAHDLRVEVLASELEAALAEAEAIRREAPPYNRLAKHLPRIAFVRLHLRDRFPRLSVSGKPRPGDDRYIGPFRSRKEAGQVVELLARMFQLRTCSMPLQPAPEFEACEQLALGACSAPCAAQVDEATYRNQVERCLRFVSQPDEASARALLRRGDDLPAPSSSAYRALRSLTRLQPEISWLADHRPSFAVFQPAVGLRAVLAYVALRGELALVRRLLDADEVEALLDQVDGLLDSDPLPRPTNAVEGLTIVAAWLRERESVEGYVFPIADRVSDDIRGEWRAACESMLRIVR